MNAAAVFRACPKVDGCPMVTARHLRRLQGGPTARALALAAALSLVAHLGAMAALSPRATTKISGGGEAAPTALGTHFEDFTAGGLAAAVPEVTPPTPQGILPAEEPAAQPATQTNEVSAAPTVAPQPPPPAVTPTPTEPIMPAPPTIAQSEAGPAESARPEDTKSAHAPLVAPATHAPKAPAPAISAPVVASPSVTVSPLTPTPDTPISPMPTPAAPPPTSGASQLVAPSASQQTADTPGPAEAVETPTAQLSNASEQPVQAPSDTAPMHAAAPDVAALPPRIPATPPVQPANMAETSAVEIPVIEAETAATTAPDSSPRPPSRPEQPPTERAETQRARVQPHAQPPSPAGNAQQNARRGGQQDQGGQTASAAPPRANAEQEGNAAASNYPGEVLRRIQRVRQARSPARGRVMVAFTVASGGDLTVVSVAQSSGNRALDQLALAHIRRAAPFPAPPPGARRQFSFEFVSR
ncbi:energy transducer TonB family protein [Roseicitreum antarcticum]|uniref:TonB family C-terminal domain-containing protein n=1 Tax=Roseicitreum antarcticum TaxID=564137 RepID=A0A1H2U9A7_9RHOB|nr:energy transducer TonB [Roseicitreum antarcticum]SDW52468.1 TonB family C-terminal domain-containing protein [Roseicitreum antarcticum]